MVIVMAGQRVVRIVLLERVIAILSYTVIAMMETYNSNTSTPFNYWLEDMGNTYSAASQTITMTAVPITSNDDMYSELGITGMTTNGADVGYLYGIKLTNGVVLDLGTGGNVLNVTLIGK